MISSIALLVALGAALVLFTHARKIDYLHTGLRSEGERIDQLRSKLANDLMRAVDATDALHALIKRHDDAAGGFWKTRSGILLRIRDMSDGHLRNAIAHIDELNKVRFDRVMIEERNNMAMELERRNVELQYRREEKAAKAKRTPRMGGGK